MSFVFDSSSLIYFGKIMLLEKIAILEGEKIIPIAVYKEVVSRGFERDEPEAKYIDELIKKKKFIVREAIKDTGDIPFLSKADKEVLFLAKETRSIAVIDEIYASEIAEAHGIECHGSLYILLKLLEKKIITKKEAINFLDRMISSGFYLSADKYRDILHAIEKI